MAEQNNHRLDDRGSESSPFARGRASQSNATGRFERLQNDAVDDGWSKLNEERGERVGTELIAEPAKTIISANDSPDIGFDRSVNPYLGCEHGCIYRFARPTHTYLRLSPSSDFETQLSSSPMRPHFSEMSFRSKFTLWNACS